MFRSIMEKFIFTLLMGVVAVNSEANCEGEWTNTHGKPQNEDNTDDIECPKEGAFTGVDISYSIHEEGKRIHSIAFICTSSLGIHRHGPFGTPGDHKDSLRCKAGHHISYFRSKADAFLNDIQIECILSGRPVGNIKFKRQCEGNMQVVNITNGIKKYVNGHERSSQRLRDFDDSHFAVGGRRPLIVHVWSKKFVSAIITKYVQKAVALNCKQSHFQLVKLAQPDVSSYEVVGVTIGSTCSTLEQQLCLTVLEGVSTNTAVHHTNTNKNRNYFAIGGSFDIGSTNFNIGADFDIGGTENIEKAVVFVYDTSEGETNTYGKSHKTTVNYKGPGVGVVVGYRRRYNIPSKITEGLWHYTCEVGSTPPTNSTLEISGNLYGNVHFQDFYFPFGNNNCTTKSRVCVSRIYIDNEVFHPQSFGAMLSAQINKCMTENAEQVDF